MQRNREKYIFMQHLENQDLDGLLTDQLDLDAQDATAAEMTEMLKMLDRLLQAKHVSLMPFYLLLSLDVGGVVA